MSSVAVALPKYRQIFQNLKDAIASGQYSPGQRLPSEAELVNVFGASRITVTRALRELQTQGIIERRVGSGSYVRIVAKAGYTFGLLIPELGQTEIFEPICRGMARAPHMEQHALLWGGSLADSAAKETEARDLCRQFIAKKVSGVFFAPLELTAGKDTANRGIAEVFDEAGIPIVLLDRDLVAYPDRSRYDLIGIDNRRAGYVMTKHLLGLGCKRLAFVGRPRSAPTVDARIAGYREAVLDAHGEFEPQSICRIEPWEKEQVNDILQRLRPEGIVCANDYTAGQLMRTFNELSVVVPDEIRVTGMDDVKYASLLPVPLTTLHQPCAEIGATAVAHMIQRLEDPNLPARDTLLDFHIVVRQSCGSKEVH